MRTLDTFERAMVRTHRHSPFNVVSVLHLVGGPTPAQLGVALARLAVRHPLLTARIVDGRFEAVAGSELRPRILDRREGEQWREVAEADLNAALDLATSPLLRCTLVSPPELHDAQQRSELILTLPHVVADASSVALMIDDLLRFCAGLPVDDSTIPVMPAPEVRFPAEYRGLAGRVAKLKTLVAEAYGELSFRLRVGRKGELPTAAGSRCRLVEVGLDREQTADLQRRAARARVTVASAWSAALLLALRNHLHAGADRPMRIFTIASFRRQVDPPIEPRPLGVGWAMIRSQFPVRGMPDLWELAGDIGSEIHRALKRGERFSAYLASESLMKLVIRLRAWRMANLAISYTGRTDLESVYGGIEVARLQAFVSTLDVGPECIAQIRIHDQRLGCGLVYLDSDMTRSMARSVADRARDSLTAGEVGDR